MNNLVFYCEKRRKHTISQNTNSNILPYFIIIILLLSVDEGLSEYVTQHVLKR